ncbi:MAG: dihydrofolate reductase family protein [Nitriliruptorales bacterium]
MGSLVVGTFLTLDGVYQAPGGRDEDREGGFQHGGWTAPYWDDELGRRIVEVTTRPDALLLGRKTYEIFAGYWPNADPTDPVAAHLNNVRKYVASRSLDQVEWNNARLIRGDVAEQVAKLKEEHEEIAVTGSGDLIQTLLRHDLVDMFGLWIFPLIVGSGKRLFGGGTLPGALTLTDSFTSDTGVIVANYERAGAVRTGEVG